MCIRICMGSHTHNRLLHSPGIIAPTRSVLNPGRSTVQIYCGGDFEFIKTLANYMPIDKPLTYLDAGSNIGCASVLFAHSIMGRGQVVAVDANPETVKVRRVREHVPPP